MLVHRTTEQASTPTGHHEAEFASPLASKLQGHGLKPQHASHVTDFNCWKALAHLRATGACGRKASRKLTDDEFDDNQFSAENGDGSIY